MKFRTGAASLAFALVTAASAVQAQLIVGPTGGVINSSGPGSGLLSHTYDQSGLSAGYTSGVTNFATYLASNPMHTEVFAGFEWFGNSGDVSASVTYDLGSVMGIDALALWNEESSGIGLLDLWGSTDNVTFNSLSLGITPVDYPIQGGYPAQVFGFAASNVRYVRFDMSRCPQPNPGSYLSCAIGEVAFQTGSAGTVVPEPGTYVLMLSGLAALGVVARRRRSV